LTGTKTNGQRCAQKNSQASDASQSLDDADNDAKQMAALNAKRHRPSNKENDPEKETLKKLWRFQAWRLCTIA
jgi:hypothetical protein|tara:strand:+ start:109 stop:327 length:219 start_codon:yes stop_codon:yes gene_type:complete